MRIFHVYILASKRRTLYIGVTSDLLKRLWQHRFGGRPGFTTRYRIDKLVHFEQYADARTAIAREKELKQWRRARKERLVATHNAGWLDLSADWFETTPGETVDPGCSTRVERRS
jgi:putative endonuclease